MSNKSPKGSNDCASNWLRKKMFSVQSSGTSSFWKVSKMMFQTFYPVSGRLSEYFIVHMQSTAWAEVRTQLMHQLQAVALALPKSPLPPHASKREGWSINVARDFTQEASQNGDAIWKLASESIFYSGHGICTQPDILEHSVHSPLTCKNWTSWNSSWMNLRDGSRNVQCASK